MRPDILKYLGSLVASTLLLMMVVVLPATATDLAIGYLSSACDGDTASVSWQITTDREGESASHPLIRVEWKPEGGDSWQLLGEGALNEGNSYVYASSKSGIDFAGATRIDVKATAVGLAKGGAHWGDGRTAGDSYTSTLPVDPCQDNVDPTQFARVNWSAGCKTSPKQPTVLLYNDATPNPDAPSSIQYDVIATMDGVEYTETVTVDAGMSEQVRLEFVKDGAVLNTEDRSISVLVNIGDRTEFKRTFKIDCVDDAVPTASVFGDCGSRGGMIVADLANSSDTPTTFVVTIDGEVVKTVELTDDAERVTIPVPEDGSYDVVVTADGVEIFNDSIDVDCFDEPTPPTASFTEECANGVGLVTVTIVNDGLDPVEFVVTIDGEVVETTTFANDTMNLVFNDIADGSHTITVTADGETILTDSFDVDCDNAVPAEPSATVIGECADVDVEGGVIAVTTSNPSVTPTTFVVTIDGVEVDSFDQADETGRVTTYDVEEGVHTVVVTADGEQVASDEFDIDCPPISPPLEPTASVLGACDEAVSDGSTLTFTLNNPTDEALTFAVTVVSGAGETTTESVTVPAESTDTLDLDVAAEIYEVTVVADGLTLVDQVVDVTDCTDVQAATIETACNTSTGETTFIITNTQGTDGSFMLTLGGVDYDLGLIAEGDSESLTLLLENGSYAFELFRDGELVDTGSIPVDCAGTVVPTAPSASIFGECDDTSSNGGGLITVDLDNPTGEAVTYVITASEDIAGEFTETVTVAANDTDSITLPVSAGIYSVDVTVDGDSIANEIVDLTDCTPVQAFSIEVECVTGGIATAKGTFQYTVAGDYVITVGSASDDLGTVAANQTFAFSLPVTSGSQAYTLTRDGVEIESGTLPIPSCVSPTGVARTGLSTDLLVPSALAMLVLGFGMVAIARRRDAI